MVQYKKTLASIVVIIAIISSIFVTVNFLKEKCIITINGDDVCKAEFVFHMNNNISQTYNYFYKKYNVEDSRDFWTTQYNGETPLTHLKEITVKQLIERKNIQQLLYEYGVAGKADFDDLQTELEKVNQHRAEAIRNKQTIYGPEQYSLQEYDTYTLSNNVTKLKQVLDEQVFKIADNELSILFEQIKDEYKLEDTVILNIDGQEYIFNDANKKYNEETHPEISAVAQDIKKGETKNIQLSNNYSSTIYCVDRIAGGYTDFETAKDSLRKKIIDEKYNQLLNERIERSTVKVNQNLYQNIKID